MIKKEKNLVQDPDGSLKVRDAIIRVVREYNLAHQDYTRFLDIRDGSQLSSTSIKNEPSE